ncbi:hypothetical protein CP532_1567 [Ophiocordyceps camponoti-leonardi (nom. inval.)]|nr:hypothetical protein CP532_1567 [Ophiocordyceps camponoti-leonardi (nom. inval.)]
MMAEDHEDVQSGAKSTDDVVEGTNKGKGKATFTERLQASGKAALEAVTGTSTMPDIVPGEKTAAAGPSSSTTHLEEASSRRAVQTGPAEPFRATTTTTTTRLSSEAAFSSFIEAPAQHSRSAQPSSSAIADQEAADGSAVAHLLSLPDEEMDAYETTEEQIPPHEAARLREALFTDKHDHPTWNQLLDFTPNCFNPTHPTTTPSSRATSMLHLAGKEDQVKARHDWLGLWLEVFASYTRDVWGDLGSLAAEAKAEVERSIVPSADRTAYLGPDICCQNGQTCALDAHNSPACCPAGAVCTGTAPASPPPTAAVSYVPNQFFSYPYAATSFDNSASCASAIHACSSNYDACVTGLQRDAAYAVTVNVPGGKGLTLELTGMRQASGDEM